MDTVTRERPTRPPAPAVPRSGPVGATRPRWTPPWTFLRFAGAGAAGNLVHAAVFLLLTATPSPVAVVNVVATVVSTVTTNELHRRFTFRAAATPWFRGHGVGGAAAVTGLLLSTSALTLFHQLRPEARALGGLLLVQAVTAVVGLTNFLVLRRALRPTGFGDVDGPHPGEPADLAGEGRCAVDRRGLLIRGWEGRPRLSWPAADR